MRIVSTSYTKIGEFNNPEEWLKRISFYTGILEELAKKHEVISIERINYKGIYRQRGVEYHFIHLKGKVAFFPWRMHRFIRGKQPDVVLVHGFIFPLQIIQLGWVCGKKTKIIVQNHAERPSSGIRKFFQRMADRYISVYFFTAKEIGREWVEKGIVKKKKNSIHIRFM